MPTSETRTADGRTLDVLKGLEGKSVIVTGAAGGIGVEVCRRLVAEGARVIAADLDADQTGKVVADIGGEIVAVGADVTTPEGNQACIAAAVEAYGRLDLFHANAGVEGLSANVIDFDPANYARVFSVNVLGSFLGAQAALRQFKAQDSGGGILFTASLAAVMGTPGTSVYNSSKHAVHGLLRCLVKEVGPQIRVNMLAPGVVDTRMMRSLEGSMGALVGLDAETFKAAMTQGVPLGRYAGAEEIAATAAWILSDEVPYLHGEMITVGGGITP